MADAKTNRGIQMALAYFGGSQSALATALEVKRQAVQGWVSGKYRISTANAIKLNQITGIALCLLRPDVYPSREEK